MTMTVATGPFGHAPAGEFNREMPDRKGLIYFEDFPRRMRAIVDGETVVDSRNAKLLHEHGLLPVLYFPEDEVRTDLLEPSDKHTHCPWKGDASYWHLRVGDQLVENAAWYYPEPSEGAPPLAGYIAFYWNKADKWLQEDEETIGHVQDPYHRLDALETSRHVKVSLDGEVLADTTRAVVLYETGLPPRWYIPREDVVAELEESDNDTICAYKGHAAYHHVRVNGDLEENLVWHYEEPFKDAEKVRGYLSFYNERVDIELDGELQERPFTPFSPGWKGEVTSA